MEKRNEAGLALGHDCVKRYARNMNQYKWIQNFVEVHYLTASWPTKFSQMKKKIKIAWLCVYMYLQKEEHHYKYLKWKLFYISFSGAPSENRSQVGLSSTTHACFRRKMYQKKTCCVPLSFCNFPKTWSPYDADYHSHDTVPKIARYNQKRSVL